MNLYFASFEISPRFPYTIPQVRGLWVESVDIDSAEDYARTLFEVEYPDRELRMISIYKVERTELDCV